MCHGCLEAHATVCRNGASLLYMYSELFGDDKCNKVIISCQSRPRYDCYYSITAPHWHSGTLTNVVACTTLCARTGDGRNTSNADRKFR